jgi:hypothetical protein
MIGREEFIFQIEYVINDPYGIEAPRIVREQRAHSSELIAKQVAEEMMRKEEFKSYKIYKLSLGVLIAERKK